MNNVKQAANFDDSQAIEAALREELNSANQEKLIAISLSVARKAERDDLQQRLTVAERRAAEFAELLVDSKEIMSDISDKSYVPDALTALSALALMEKIDDALKSAADVSHEIPGTSGMRLNMLANQGE